MDGSFSVGLARAITTELQGVPCGVRESISTTTAAPINAAPGQSTGPYAYFALVRNDAIALRDSRRRASSTKDRRDGLPGSVPKSTSGWRRKNGKAKQDLSKTPPASNAKAALPAKGKRVNDAKRNRMAKRKATSKREAKPTAKSTGAKRSKRAIKANKKPKGKGNRKQKGENKDDT
jgi:hypothetical protein